MDVLTGMIGLKACDACWCVNRLSARGWLWAVN